MPKQANLRFADPENHKSKICESKNFIFGNQRFSEIEGLGFEEKMISYSPSSVVITGFSRTITVCSAWLIMP
jgi:hypothetical protein